MLKRILILCLVVLLLSACDKTSSERIAPTEKTASTITQGQRLLLSATVDFHSTQVCTEGLTEEFANGILFLNVKDVTILINGEEYPLEAALRDHRVSFEEIYFSAQLDAENGFCEELYQSSHGLTLFTYRYPEFDLGIICDVFETPDGQQHLIHDLTVSNHGGIGVYTDFYDDQTGERLDREDWGISLEVVKSTPTGITLSCEQTGGQQIGTIYTNHFLLGKGSEFLETLSKSAQIPSYEVPIAMDSYSQVELDWTDIYGKLPSGEYWMILYLKDHFDETDLHTLMDDFHNMQGYTIQFTIY